MARPGGESLQEPLRQLDRGAGVLALAVAADSTLEHCRGDFRNRAMYAPLLSSGLSLLAGSQRLREALPQTHRLRDAIALGSVLTGLAGTGFTSGTSPGVRAASAGATCSMPPRSARRRRWCCPVCWAAAPSACATRPAAGCRGRSACRPAGPWR
ncbi:hypothetical protein ACE0DR_11855 [Azotobacter sp. CWF10]